MSLSCFTYRIASLAFREFRSKYEQSQMRSQPNDAASCQLAIMFISSRTLRVSPSLFFKRKG